MNWTPEQALSLIKAEVNRRIEAAAILVQNEVKKVLSVPAPRQRVVSHKGIIYYRATTKATPGAPPRKLSGRLRSSVTREMDRDNMRGRVGTNVKYARRQEMEYNHKFLEPAIRNLALSGLIASIGTEAP